MQCPICDADLPASLAKTNGDARCELCGSKLWVANSGHDTWIFDSVSLSDSQKRRIQDAIHEEANSLAVVELMMEIEEA